MHGEKMKYMDHFYLEKGNTAVFRNFTRRNNSQELNPPSLETFGLHLPES